MEVKIEQINKNQVSIQILETTAGKLFSLRNNENETLNDVIERVLNSGEKGGLAIDMKWSAEEKSKEAQSLTKSDTNLNPIKNKKISTPEISFEHKSRSVPTRQYNGGHHAFLFNHEIRAPTIYKLFAEIVDLVDEIDTSVIERLSEITTSPQRGIVSRNKNGIHLKARQFWEKPLETFETKRGWWIDANVGQPMLENRLRKLCDVAGIEFGKDLKWERQTDNTKY